jgi:regulator of sigma E protease
VILYAIMISRIGMPVLDQVLVVNISPDSPAEAAGLQDGDLIMKINKVEVDSTTTLRNEIYQNLGTPIAITYHRGETIGTTSLVPRLESEIPAGEGAIGIQMTNPTQPIRWWSALPYGVLATYNHSLALINLPFQVVRGEIAPELARPVGYVGMFTLFQEFREQDTDTSIPSGTNTIFFFIMVTISLGIFNLLPIPALDGGRILFALPEIVLRRRIPIAWQNWINLISFVTLILIFFYINILDVTNPIQLPPPQ